MFRRASVVLAAAGAVLGLAMAPAGAAGGWVAGGWVAVPDPDSSRWFDAFLTADDGTVIGRGGFSPGEGDGEVASFWVREGSAWKLLPKSEATPYTDTFGSGVWSATSAKDFWVVGGISAKPAIVSHWNGSAWQDRSPADQTVHFDDVEAVSAGDVWAVGTTQWKTTTPTQAAVIGHWEGGSWKITKLPQAVGGRTRLFDVQVNSAADVWASGESCTDQESRNCRGYVVRWNGASWTEVPVPAGITRVSAMTADAAGQVWVAHKNTVLRWNGSGWSTGADVVGVGSDGVNEFAWADGKLYAGLDLSSSSRHSGIVRWNGTSWESLARPIDNPDYSINQITSLAGRTDGELWAAGSYNLLWSNPPFAARLPAGAAG
ncbi:hypothetical protein [Streptomyces sp. S.PB5]|uniref:hypothetical protein n=1 Tax=Streptomyces sp. S.PB5 TaxID=3020844 RepID=UPI0025B15AB0|nr:hypothetical protein [Streptomyces sp. S.PB5]MDN3028241.1 hypothetical protein [Streptomyces sp. S.PB5]